jgi:hypothetical protein
VVRVAIAPHPQVLLFVVPPDAGIGVGENARAVAAGGAISVSRRLLALGDHMTTESPRVDIGALAVSLYSEPASRLARTVVLAMDHLEEDGRELNQLQKIALVRAALREAEGLERRFAEDIKTTLENDGVQTWGLDHDLERLLGNGGGDA